MNKSFIYMAEKLNKRGISNTTPIMVNISNAKKRKMENAIENIGIKLGSSNSMVVKGSGRPNKGLITRDEGKYRKTIEETYKLMRHVNQTENRATSSINKRSGG